MSSSFDLSPVLGLLHGLSSSVVDDNHSVGQQKASQHKRDIENNGDANIGHSKTLGDFSPLWQFLESVADTPVIATTTPPGAATNRRKKKKNKKRKKKRVDTDFEEGAHSDLEPDSVLRAGGFKKTYDEPQVRRVVTFATTTNWGNDTDEDNVINSTVIPNSSRHTYSYSEDGVNTTRKSNGIDIKPHPKHIDGNGGTASVIKSTCTPEVRKINIIQKLLSIFPEGTSTLLSPVSFVGKLTRSGIHVFIDNSNILIGFYEHIKTLSGFSRNDFVRRPAFSFHGLSLILERGRPTAKKVLVGSSPITRVVLEAREQGYETSILERVEKDCTVPSASSGSESAATRLRRRKVEQAVDEICHLKILESVLDYPPSTIVLATGDGGAGEYSPGFFKMIERCLLRGWAVEVVAFKRNLSGFYRDKDFKKVWKDKFRFVPLDSFAQDLLG